MTDTHTRGASATSPFELRLEQLLAPFTDDKPGLAALVSIGGAAVFECYLGGADLEHAVPITAATGFHIASVSKQFTAFAALLEAEDGRLDLAADVRAYLPEVPNFGAPITVADLIHHTSGLRDVADLLGLSGIGLGGDIRQRATVELALRQRELNFAPGSRHHYSNTGYTLLAQIIARTAGRPLPRYLETEVFAPLAMRDSLVCDNRDRLLSNEAISYRLTARGEVRHLRLYNSCYGPRGVYTTARDLAKWARELLSPSVFPPELIGRMTSPGRLPGGKEIAYGFGLLCGQLAGQKALTHYGGDQGYAAAFQLFPDLDASVIVLSNGQADVAAIAEALTAVHLNALPPTPIAPDTATLAELEGYYVWGGDSGLTLEASDAKLMASKGGAPVEAKFLPDGGFYLVAPPIRFTRGPDGELSEFGGVAGSELVHRRRTRVQPSAAELAALAGSYRSDEIDSTYELAVQGGGLALSCLRFGPLAFAPADQDAFDGPGMRLAIARDDGGAVTGMRISTWCSWDLWFRRLE
jgi:CubicO group peptidase (beta-lactamase class C family)